MVESLLTVLRGGSTSESAAERFRLACASHDDYR
jgi:hypothetical protein